jgi:hypothetical protein
MTDYSTLMPSEAEALDRITEMNANFAFPKITESEFVNKYLPILTYNFTRPNEEHLKVKTEIWVREVSRNPYYSVNVVSDIDHSTILYWVPPVLRSGKVFRQTKHEDSFLEVMHTAWLKGKTIPKLKDIHLNYELESRLDGNVSLTEDQRQWYRILSYYRIFEYGGESSVQDVPPVPTGDVVIFGEVDEL